MSGPTGKDEPYTPAPLPPEMDPPAGVTPAGEATDLPDDLGAGKGGWDEARGSAEIPPRAPRAAWWTPHRRRWAAVATLAVVLFLAAMVAIPNLLASKIACEPAAPQNLKALCNAQAQYIKKYDCYADAGWRLNAAGTLIAADLTNAFEDWQGNGDSLRPQPKAGYIFRMLHGNELVGVCGFYKDPSNPNAGMVSWAATCRAAEPGTSGEVQYYITEAGTVYKYPEPPPGDSQYKTFLLDRAPPQNQITWRTAK